MCTNAISLTKALWWYAWAWRKWCLKFLEKIDTDPKFTMLSLTQTWRIIMYKNDRHHHRKIYNEISSYDIEENEFINGRVFYKNDPIYVNKN